MKNNNVLGSVEPTDGIVVAGSGGKGKGRGGSLGPALAGTALAVLTALGCQGKDGAEMRPLRAPVAVATDSCGATESRAREIQWACHGDDFSLSDLEKCEEALGARTDGGRPQLIKDLERECPGMSPVTEEAMAELMASYNAAKVALCGSSDPDDCKSERSKKQKELDNVMSKLGSIVSIINALPGELKAACEEKRADLIYHIRVISDEALNFLNRGVELAIELGGQHDAVAKLLELEGSLRKAMEMVAIEPCACGLFEIIEEGL